MVLADFSPALRPEPANESRRSVRGVLVTVLAAAAVIVVCLGFTSNASQPIAELQTKPIANAARAAEQTLQHSLRSIKNRNSYQGKSLAKAMNDALSAVNELEGTSSDSGSQHDVKKIIAAKRVAKHLSDIRVNKFVDSRVKHAQENAQARLRANSKMDEAISTDLKLKENGAVRDELRKLVETAKHLTAEMKKLHNKHLASGEATNAVKRRAAEVVQVGMTVEQAKKAEAEARKKVVKHELEVEREKLAEAEEEEKAAGRASAQARDAEREAAKLHREAAKDEVTAEARRRAAERARRIAREGARGRTAQLKKDAARQPKPVKQVDLADEAPLCTDKIAKVGCQGLRSDDACVAFCKDSDGSTVPEPRAARSPALQPVETGYAVHRRSGYFASGAGQGSYVDSVYGDKADVASVFSHPRTGFFVGRGGGSEEDGDVAAGSHDVAQVEEGEAAAPTRTGKVLAQEKQMQSQLQAALEQSQEENRELHRRVSEQQADLSSLSHSLSYLSARPDQSASVLRNTPPLPAYKAAEGTQDLAEMPTRAALQQAGVPLDEPLAGDGAVAAINRGSELHDPYRP